MADNINWKTKAGDFANIFKAFIGTNYLSLPYGFLISGIGFGLVGLLFVAFFTDYCCCLMVKCKYYVIESLCQKYIDSRQNKNHNDLDTQDKVNQLRTRLTKHLDYADLVRLIFGKMGTYAINFFIIITQAGFCMNYFIVIGNSIQMLFPLYFTNATISPDSPLSELLEKAQEPRDILYLAGNNAEYVNYAAMKTATQFLQMNESGSESTELFISTVANLVSGTTTKRIIMSTELTTLPEIQNISSPDTMLRSSAPPLYYLVLLPLPILILFTYFREVRQLSAISFLANTCACVGFIAVVIYIVADFHLTLDIQWWVGSGLLVYIGQASGAFEAIALILPIEASMQGTRHLFPRYLHGAIVLMALIIAVMAVIGYLAYGADTQQIILLNLPAGQPFTIAINVLMIVGILCTYPLQIMPVILIMESTLFGQKNETAVHEIDETNLKGENSPLLSSGGLEESYNPFELSVAYHIPKSIPTWKRNLVRTLVAVATCGLAVLLRNVLAYSLALVGALGSCPLAYIIPCLMYLKLRYHHINKVELILNIFSIMFGTVFGIVGVVLALMNIIEKA